MLIKIKTFIARYFKSFAFFYFILRGKIFIALGLSIGVSVLDVFGLTMFIPLMQVVDEGGEAAGKGMGKLSFLLDLLEKTGLSLTLFSVLLIMVAFFLLKGILVYLAGIYSVFIKQSFIRKIRMSLVGKLNELSFKHFTMMDAGRVQNTVTGEVNRVSEAFDTYLNTLKMTVIIGVYSVFAFLSNAQFAVLVVVSGALINLIYLVAYKKIKQLSIRLTHSNNDFQGLIIQYVAHLKYLRVTGMLEKYSQNLRASIYEIEESRRKIGVFRALAVSVREPIMVLILVIVIFIQVQVFKGAFTSMVLSLLFFYKALGALISIQNSWSSFLSKSGSMQNMQDFYKELERGRTPKGKLEMNRLTQGITLKEVSFAYGETPILAGIDLSIKKKESLAFVGESGCGKTTLINLIVGLLPENKGQIYIDDYALKDIKKESYQSRIGYVTQDPVIFNDTLYHNVTFWAPQTRENIKRFERAVEHASLREFLNELPQGKETQLGHNGINLSGGQKQRVSIARELFKEIEILILDEATSALDSETEKIVQKSIDSLKGQYTILSIAHRLATIKNADRIVLMEKGEIIDIGDFDTLQKKQERFRKMVELQEL